MNLEEPLPSDCCGSGCSPCVFDIYQKRLQDGPAANSANEYLRTDLLSETRFKPFKLLKKKQIAECVFELRFQPIVSLSDIQNEEMDIHGFLPYSIGQHLFLRCSINESSDAGIPLTNSSLNVETHFKSVLEDNKNSEKLIVIRAYTPITISTNEKNCCFNIFVKFYKNGTASEYLKGSSIGDTFYWRGPYGSFQYVPNSFSHIVMLCMGTGLAPMISLINSILYNEDDDTLVHLKCCFKNINHVILRNEITKMAHFWNFTVEYYFSEATKYNESIQFGEKINVKRLDKYSVEGYIKNISFKHLLVLICGTKCFATEMKSIISELKMANINMHVF